MEPLRQGAVRAVCQALAAQPASPAKVACIVRLLAGPALARAMTVRWSPNGIVTLTAKSDLWRREIERARPMLHTRLAETLGGEVVRRVVVEHL